MTSSSSCNHDLINHLFIHCILVCLLLLLFISCMLQVALQILLNFILWLTNLFLLCCVLVKKKFSMWPILFFYHCHNNYDNQDLVIGFSNIAQNLSKLLAL